MMHFKPIHLQTCALLLALLSGMQVRAFDGGGYEATPTQTAIDWNSLESLPDYSNYHAQCLEQERRMWGDVAELMEDLATSHCTCVYIGLEENGRFNLDSREKTSDECYRQATRNNKERFIQWALPLHQQRLQQTP